MGNERDGRDRKGSKVLSLDDLESGGVPLTEKWESRGNVMDSMFNLR